MFRKIFPLMILTPLFVTGVALAAATDNANEQTLTLTLPKGDAKAGMVAFRSLGCFNCHPLSGVEGQKVRSPVSSTSPAPLLDSRLAKMDAGELATSIVAPSHKVSSVVAEQSGGKLSPMGDYSEVLTVRQLADLVAYLQSLTDELRTK